MKHYGCQLDGPGTPIRHKRSTNFNQIVHNYYAVPIYIMKSRFWGLRVPHIYLFSGVDTQYDMFGKSYVLSVAAPCCFSEATLGEFSAMSGSPMTLLLAPYSRCRSCFEHGEMSLNVKQVSSSLLIDSGFLYILAWTPPTTF